MSPDDPRHGTSAGHNAGCRCIACSRAKLRYDKRRRADARATGRRVVPCLPAARRLRALQALGWSTTVLGDESGLHRGLLHDISSQRHKVIYRRTDAIIRDVYDRLSGTVPTGPYVTRNRRYAERQGWPPPLAWDDIDDPNETPEGNVTATAEGVDEAVVLRILAGDFSLTANPDERAEVARRWVLAGRPLRDLAKRTGWKVERYYKASDEEAA